MANWKSRVFHTVTATNIAENYSELSVTMQIMCVDKNMVGANNNNTAFYAIRCEEHQHSGDIKINFDYNNNPAGTWWTVGTQNFRVYHNRDGSNTTFNIKGFFSSGLIPAYFVAENTVTLAPLGTPGIGFLKYGEVGYSFIRIQHTTDIKCDEEQYNIGNGWIDCTPNDFKITGLKPYTKYSLKVRAKSEKYNVWEESISYTITTKQLPTVNCNSDVFGIGEPITISLSEPYDIKMPSMTVYLSCKNDLGELVPITDFPIGQTDTVVNTSVFETKILECIKTKNFTNLVVNMKTFIDKDVYNMTPKYVTGLVLNADPVFEDFTFINTDTRSNAMFGNTTSFVTLNSGNLKAIIENKAIPKKGASIDHYDIALDNIFLHSVKETTAPINILFDPFAKGGNYTLSIQAVDSRGNTSNIVSKSISVYDYHAPSGQIALERYNGFEANTTLYISFLISKVFANNKVNNGLDYLKYRFRESESNTWSAYKPLTNFITYDSGDNIQVTCTVNSFEVLDINKSYVFEFCYGDKVVDIIDFIDVNRGIPIAMITDNGKLLVGEIPDEVALNDPNKLVVGGDITAKDETGKRFDIVKTLKNLIVISETEPTDQIENGIWFKVIQ